MLRMDQPKHKCLDTSNGNNKLKYRYRLPGNFTVKKLFRVAGLLVVAGLAGIALLALPERMTTQGENNLVEGNLEGDALVKALRALSPQELDALELRETGAFERNPLDVKILQNLALIAGLRNQTHKQEQLALILPLYSKRDIASQLASANILLARGQVDEALDHLDAMLRANPETGPSVFPTIAGLVLQQKGNAKLARLLDSGAHWRRALLDYAINADEEGQAGYEILKSLRKEKLDIKDEELRALVSKLVKSNRIDKAYFVWLDFIATDDLRFVSTVFDGGFDREPKNMIFDWTLTPRQNARIGVENRLGSTVNRNLALEFLSDKGVFANVKQYLRLLGGEYKMTFEYMGKNLKAQQGLIWTLRCINEKSTLGQSQNFFQSGPWANYEFSFVVPEDNCDTQVLTLESASRAALDTQISGQMYFDSIKIVSTGAVAN
jgi:tetratricopeptide (TPR) repeat protein